MLLVLRCFSLLLFGMLADTALGADYPPRFPANNANANTAPISAPTPAVYPTPTPPAASMPAPTHSANQGGEVHIIIDTSGSMKKTDPKNLRVPSLKLLVNLLPNGSRGGVWLFDTSPVLISPVGVIDEQWKQQATRNAHTIHSRGLFTDIEAAISTSSQEWLQSPEPAGHRHLILLTDGMVDVSKNEQESAASLQRIMDKLIPALQKAGVQVYTVALSKLADQCLMRELAIKTGGWFEMADDAEQLQHAFVSLFNKTSRQDTVPLKGNRFNIDSSIEECTVLAMLRPNASPVSLSMPNGKKISLRQHHENVRWLHESGFDLITITKPEVGGWTLHGDIDPANQVMVVTHLKMEQAPPLDNFMPAGNTPDIAVRFTENGIPIQEESFLSLLTVHAELKKGELPIQELDLVKLEGISDLFSANVKTEIAPGEYTLQIAADGKTFQRAIEQKFNVLENVFQIETRDITENGSPMLLLTLTPDKSISPESINFAATLVVQTQQSLDLIPVRMGNGWQIKLHAPAPNDHWLINFNVKQRTPDGKVNSLYMKPLKIDGKPAVTPPPPVVESIEPPPALPEPPKNQTRGWQISGLLAIAINLLAGGIVWWGYKRSQRKQKAALDTLLNHLT